MELSIQIEGVDRTSRFLEVFPRETSKAVLRAMKRGTDSAGTHANRLVSADMGLKVGEVRRRIRKVNPTEMTLAGELRASLKRVPLIDFPKGGRGVPHAFLATMPSGHRGLFVRDPLRSTRRGKPPNRSGLPIRELFGPSVGRVMDKYRREIVARGLDSFRNELNRLLDRIIAAKNNGFGASDAG